MDLLAAEGRNGTRWNAAKISALFFFVVASGILIASLMLPPTFRAGSEHGLSANITAPVQ